MAGRTPRRRRSEQQADAGRLLPPAFPLTFRSGELFVLARRRFRVHIVPIAARYRGRTPVALPPVLKRMEQRMPEHRRFTQTISLEESLPEEAKRLRKQAQGTLPGIERECLVRRARQLETASRINEWLISRTKQVQ